MKDLSIFNAPVGSRLLICRAACGNNLQEVTILEWSPNGKYVKLHYSTMVLSNQHTWLADPERYNIADVLPINAGKI